MIRHIAVFRFKQEFSEEQRQAWMDMITDLPTHIPEIKAISIGRDMLRGAHSYDVGLVADFESMEGLAVYTTHPKHQPVLDMSGPVKEHLAVVDFEF
jgi:Stress responsive A/B Barrel Domain